jgi:hypothetical protein
MPWPIYYQEKKTSTHSTGAMIGLTAGPDAFMKINDYWTCQELPKS